MWQPFSLLFVGLLKLLNRHHSFNSTNHESQSSESKHTLWRVWVNSLNCILIDLRLNYLKNNLQHPSKTLKSSRVHYFLNSNQRLPIQSFLVVHFSLGLCVESIKYCFLLLLSEENYNQHNYTRSGSRQKGEVRWSIKVTPHKMLLQELISSHSHEDSGQLLQVDGSWIETNERASEPTYCDRWNCVERNQPACLTET